MIKKIIDLTLVKIGYDIEKAAKESQFSVNIECHLNNLSDIVVQEIINTLKLNNFKVTVLDKSESQA